MANRAFCNKGRLFRLLFGLDWKLELSAITVLCFFQVLSLALAHRPCSPGLECFQPVLRVLLAFFTIGLDAFWNVHSKNLVPKNSFP